MGHARPISDDKWDSWEPLVAGLPLFLRLILLQDGLVVVALAFLLPGCMKMRLEGHPEAVSSRALEAVFILSTLALYGLLVCSWLEAYKAKRWALLSLGLMSIAISIGFSVLGFLSSDDVDAVVLLPVAALAAVEGVYLLRLRARLARLGLP